MGDSFSKLDLIFAVEYKAGKQFLISGKRKDAFEYTEHYTSIEIGIAWNNAKRKMRETHWDNKTEIIFEQEEILRELKNYLKGFEYYENI